MRNILIAGNWKMNGSSVSVQALLESLKQGMDSVSNADVAVCAPFVYLAQVQNVLADSALSWGAQNLSEQASGAFTGEISARMLNDFGCKYVIIGHSERRILYGESDELVAQKFAAARQAGLTAIVCVGELLEEREAGDTEKVVGRQLDAVILRNGVAALADAVIAYEPVWAIGTGKTASPEQAQQIHAFIRQRIAAQSMDVAEKIQILYGGSMKPSNAQELLAMADIDGGLVGGASLKAEDFLAICTAAPAQ